MIILGSILIALISFLLGVAKGSQHVIKRLSKIDKGCGNNGEAFYDRVYNEFLN
jgi:hypothetical protein